MTIISHDLPTTTDTDSSRTTSDAGATTMRAVVQDRYGSADALELRTVDRPVVAPSQVLIEVHAAGVDRGVEHLMTGRPYAVRLGFGLTKPKQPVPGLDVAGRVVAVGDEVTRFRVGDRVFGIAIGAYAEYAAAEEAKLSTIPDGITMEQAGVATVSGITALQALTDVGRVEAGQHVLVLGASGGVGTYAVQIAKALGAEVTGVAGTAKVELVRSLGADHVIDYTTDDFVDGPTRYDLIIDIGGRNSIRRLRRVLTPAGTLVIVGGEEGGTWTGGIGRQIRATLLSPLLRQRLTMFLSTEHHSFIDRLADHLASGEVVPAIGDRFPLDRTADALRRLGSGGTMGKSVIVVRDAAPATS
ncbi:MAG: NAD(P)-dependent alcohol dehydrogenase [Ilumatobacteraceae bacterium]|nr:NAD(P)-dependent alcohol dehydrogenase [Ilumatobacteraceae bacterium]